MSVAIPSMFTVPKLVNHLWSRLKSDLLIDIQPQTIIDYYQVSNNDKVIQWDLKNGKALVDSRRLLGQNDLFIALYHSMGFKKGAAGTIYYGPDESAESSYFDTNQQATYRSYYANGIVTITIGNKPAVQNLIGNTFNVKNAPNNFQGVGRQRMYLPNQMVIVGDTQVQIQNSLDSNADVDTWIGGTDTTQFYLSYEMEGIVIKNGRKLITDVADWVTLPKFLNSLG